MTPTRTLNYDTFTIVETSFGYQSYDTDGKPLIFSHSEQDCSMWSHQLLKAQQDGSWSTDSRVVNDGLVGGKL